MLESSSMSTSELTNPRDQPCPALRTLLDAELAAGNDAQDTGADFPRPGSLLVRLRRKFRARPAKLQAEYELTPSGPYLVSGFQ